MPTTIGCLANNRIELTALRAAGSYGTLDGQRSGERREMLTQPVDKVGSIDTASGEIQDESFLIVDRGVDLRAVEK